MFYIYHIFTILSPLHSLMDSWASSWCHFLSFWRKYRDTLSCSLPGLSKCHPAFVHPCFRKTSWHFSCRFSKFLLKVVLSLLVFYPANPIHFSRNKLQYHFFLPFEVVIVCQAECWDLGKAPIFLDCCLVWSVAECTETAALSLLSSFTIVSCLWHKGKPDTHYLSSMNNISLIAYVFFKVLEWN